MRMSTTLALGLLALVAAGCAQPGPEPVAAPPRMEPEVTGGQRLSGEEFRAAVFGNTLDRRLPNGARLSMHVATDGSQRLRLTAPGGQRGTDRGRIDIRGNEICSSWERIDQGRPTCFAYFRLGSSLVAIDLAGQIEPTRFEVLRGNPERI
jgi:hypothetical protein